MQARTRNRMGGTAAVVMAALALAGAATHASADPRGPGLRPDPRGASPVEMRTLLQYRESAWILPTAVVLHTEQAWKDWNREAVASGVAIGEESLPAVDWNREAVLVVALGMDMTHSMTLSIKNPHRAGSTTELTLHLDPAGEMGPSNPCHVVALAKHAARNIRLIPDYTDAIAGIPAYVPLYGEAPANNGDWPAVAVGNDLGSGITPADVQKSWGALKASYR